ncbi:MAG: hypothetical protein IH934_06235 [Nanoarchaeota archaeon]|nr:hypothetical protein [Nanoarchaeota archaeon]
MLHRKIVITACIDGKPIISRVGHWLNDKYPNRKHNDGIDIVYHSYDNSKKNVCCIMVSNSIGMLNAFIKDFKLKELKPTEADKKCKGWSHEMKVDENGIQVRPNCLCPIITNNDECCEGCIYHPLCEKCGMTIESKIDSENCNQNCHKCGHSVKFKSSKRIFDNVKEIIRVQLKGIDDRTIPYKPFLNSRVKI